MHRARSAARPRLIAAYLDAGGRLVCGFEGARKCVVSLRELGVAERPRVALVCVDDLRSGIILLREDGKREDVSADLVLYCCGASYRQDAAAGELGARIADRLRLIRKTRGLSQRAMATLLELQGPNYARLESGRHTPSVATLVRVADRLRVPLTYLVAVSPHDQLAR